MPYHEFVQGGGAVKDHGILDFAREEKKVVEELVL